MELKNVFKKAESKRHLPEGIAIQPREFDIEVLRQTPKLWLENNPISTIGTNVFSLYIPRGELFFIRSVRHFKDQIKDPELKSMIVAFMQQETLHAKAHDAFNESFKNYGFDVDSELKFINEKFEWIEKYVPKKIQLGMTVFFEHLTATRASSALTNLPNNSTISEEVKAFLMWHAAEELEHKNVAFDVFKEVGGGYFLRIFSALLGPYLLFPYVKETTLRMTQAYNEPLTDENKLQFKMRKEKNKTEMLKSKQAIKQYFQPFFHPNKIKDTHLLFNWYKKTQVA